MKRILYIMIALCLTSFVAYYSMSPGAIASEKKGGEKVKKTMAKDPICGMKVQKDKSTKVEHNGKNYYFCSERCEETFKKEPSKYERKKRNEINDLSKGRKTYTNYLPWNKDRLIIYSKMNKYIDNYVRKCYILKRTFYSM